MKRMPFYLCLAASVFMLLVIMTVPAAAEYPEKPITILCWSKPGSTVDLLGRALCKIGEKYVGAPMSIVTKSGGGGTVALAHLKKQKADGYTLLMATRSYAFLMAWQRTSMKPTDFQLISRLIVENPMLAVNANRPYSTWEEFKEYAKKHPNTIKVSNSGSGQLHHTLWLMVKKKAGITSVDVPYDGGRPAINSVIGGHDDAVVNNPSVMKGPIKDGKLKGIFMLGGERIDALPDVPTLKELGIPIDEYHWRGVMSKAGVPKDRVAHLARAFEQVTKDPEWQPMLEKFTWGPGYMGPDEFTEYANKQTKEIRETLMDAGLIK